MPSAQPVQAPTNPQSSNVQPSPIDRAINRLRAVCTCPYWCDTQPLDDEPRLRMDSYVSDFDLTPLELSINKIPDLAHHKVCRWLASNSMLPCLRRFKTACIDDPQTRNEMFHAFNLSNLPWKEESENLAICAKDYNEIISGSIQFTHPHRDAMIKCAFWVRLLVQDSKPIIMYYLDECMFPDMERLHYEQCARALLTAYPDIRTRPTAFMSTLLKSSFAEPMTWQARKLRHDHLGFKKVIGDAEYRTSSIIIQQALIAFGDKMKWKTMQPFNSTDENLKVVDKEHKMATRLTSLLQTSETGADDRPELLLAINNGLALQGPTTSAQLPARIKDHNSTCTLGCNSIIHTNGAPVSVPIPAKREAFARADMGWIGKPKSLIVPSIKSSPTSHAMHAFTNEEQLGLFVRYKEVHIQWKDRAISEEGVPLSTSQIWLRKWAAIAEVLPGRGVADCIRFYNEHAADFRFSD